MAIWTKVCGAALVAGVVGTGCVVPQDDADRFREAVPHEDEVKLRVPGGQGGEGAVKTQGLAIRTFKPSDGTARYYRFTRDMTNVVDLGTAVILGSIWALVNTEPTTVDAKTAIWGPGRASALEPAVWRFRVTEVGEAEYDYALEGQPKSGGDFLPVLRGHGYGKAHPKHKTGWFEANNEAMRTLDPDRAKDAGSIKVTYDLTRLPATLAVELRLAEQRGWADITVTHEPGGAGSVELRGLGDVDDTRATALEDVHIVSRWTTAGSGRADVELANGDLPGPVTATECWSDSFRRVYYEDSVDFEPSSGDASACALSSAR